MGNRQVRVQPKPLLLTFSKEIMQERGCSICLRNRWGLQWTLKLNDPVHLRKCDPVNPLVSTCAKIVKNNTREFLIRGILSNGLHFGLLVRKANCSNHFAHFILYEGYDEYELRFLGHTYSLA